MFGKDKYRLCGKEDIIFGGLIGLAGLAEGQISWLLNIALEDFVRYIIGSSLVHK